MKTQMQVVYFGGDLRKHQYSEAARQGKQGSQRRYTRVPHLSQTFALVCPVNLWANILSHWLGTAEGRHNTDVLVLLTC